jgi:parallel beta-helix repeat protein
VNQNIISDFDLVKNDGGAIHTYDGRNHTSRTNQKIQSNIINNGTGEKSGTTSGYSGATGIYLDVASENIEVTDNTLFNCTGAGIFLHGTNNILVSGNTSYGNNIQFFMTDAYPDGYASKSNVISNNIFVNKNANQLEERLLQQNSKPANETSFPNTVFKANPKLNNQGGLPAGNDAVLFEANKSNKPKNVRLTGSYKDINGNDYHDNVVIRPYGSIILFKVR